jgi:hypothetical protein
MQPENMKITELFDFVEQSWRWRILIGTMESRVNKRRLSAHQKQIRFLTSLCIIAVILFTALIFWLANAPTLPGH